MEDTFSTITRQRLEELSDLISREENFPALTLETLLDTFVAVYTDCKAATNQSDQISLFLSKYQSVASKLETTRINTKDFDTIKTLATGAVGKVCLVKSKKTGQVYAMKAAFFMEERNVLVFSQKSEWITTLYASFQDEENLYLLMEYVSGASFRAFMNNRETIMEENEARFYIAEMVLALADLHSHRYIHRDVKPENYLLDSKGHIKLADFGSCIRLVKDKVSSQIAVGTPDYISPEILRANEGNAEYGLEVDWWSLGIILYELLCDEVPFYSESLVGTYGKIMNHETTFAFPDDITLSDSCKDLISRLICKSEMRLGVNGVHEIKNHPWFKGIDWENIRKNTAPFIPELSGPEDTRYFEDEENETKKFVKKTLPKTKEFSGNSLAFVGYGYVRNATAQVVYPSENKEVGTAVISLDTHKKLKLLKEAESKTKETISKLESTIQSLDLEKKKLEAEKEQLRFSHEQIQSDNLDLQNKVASLRKITLEAKENSNMIQELNEIRAKLEKELEDTSFELRAQKEEAIKLQISLTDTTKGKAALESKLKETVDGIHVIQAERDSLAEKLTNNTIVISQKSQELTEASAKASKLSNELDMLNADMKAKIDIIAEKQSQIQKQNEQIRNLEKELAILKLDQLGLQSKINTLTSDNESLFSEVTFLKRSMSSSVTFDTELESLKTQLSSAQQAKAKLSDELMEISKLKATMAVELALNIKEKLDARKEISDLAESLKNAEAKAAEISKSLEALHSEKSSVEMKLSSAEIELKQAQKLVSGLESTNRDLEALLDEKEALYTSLLNENQTVLGNLQLEKAHAISLEEKLKKADAELASERKIRISAETAVEETSTRLEETNAENDTKVQKLEAEILALETDLKILQIDFMNEKLKADGATEQLNHTNNELEKASSRKIQAEEFYAITRNELSETKSELQKSLAKIEELSHKIHEYEKQNRAMKTKVEILTTPTREDVTESVDLQRKTSGHQYSTTRIPGMLEKHSPASKSNEKLFSRARMSAMFFKSKENVGDTSPERSVLSPERTTSEEFHSRKVTRQSYLSNSESSFTVTKLPATVTILDFFNPLDGLSGWIKVPKGGKVKKGWTSLFLAFTQDKLMTFNSQDDFLKDKPGKLVCEISCEIFVARSVSQNELIHATAKEIDLIFKIQAHTPKHSSLTEEEIEAKEKRIAVLKDSIALEAKMLEATQKILDVTSESQKVTVIGQIDAANKRMRTFKNELEKLTDPSKKFSSLADLDINTEINELKKELEAQIQDEQKKRDFLTQLAIADKKKHKHFHSEQSKDIEVELLLCDRLIAKLKEQIDILNSNNGVKKQELLDKNREKAASSNAQGHVFSQRQYFKPTDCSICSEPLWDTKNVGLECSSCKLICHKDCGNHIDISCANQGMLKNIPPLYFMAQDTSDRSRWLAGLQYYRRNTESIRSNDVVHKLKSFVEPVGRMSMMPIKKAA